jgi:hypothetical protein
LQISVMAFDPRRTTLGGILTPFVRGAVADDCNA